MCSSLTTEDLPTPEYPETRTNSGAPLATTRSKAASKASTSRSRPYSFSGIISRSGISCSPSGNGSMRPVALPFGKATPKITLQAGSGLIALLGSLGEQLHDDGRDGGRDAVQPLRWAAIGFLAIWQCTHSIGSEAVNGRRPVSIW